MKKKLSKSMRKYVRKEKTRIRREISDLKKQKELIKQLYQKFTPHLSKTATKQ